MLRGILALILAYVVIAVAVFVLLVALFSVLGVDGAFRPGSWEVTTNWIVGHLAADLLAAMAAGWVCAKVAKGSRPVKIFAGLVLVLGLLMATMNAITPPEDPGARGDAVDVMEAMQSARPPSWLEFLAPVTGLVGVLLGARMAGRKRA